MVVLLRRIFRLHLIEAHKTLEDTFGAAGFRDAYISTLHLARLPSLYLVPPIKETRLGAYKLNTGHFVYHKHCQADENPRAYKRTGLCCGKCSTQQQQS